MGHHFYFLIDNDGDLWAYEVDVYGAGWHCYGPAGDNYPSPKSALCSTEPPVEVPLTYTTYGINDAQKRRAATTADRLPDPAEPDQVVAFLTDGGGRG